MRDAIIVGGGIAGMSAAWRLRHSDIIALEAGNRIGGRLRSERRGKYWLNWGGHVFGGEGSYADKLLKEVGVDALDLPGSFSALSFKGKTLNGGNVNLYPLQAAAFLGNALGDRQGRSQGHEGGQGLRQGQQAAQGRGLPRAPAAHL